MLGNPPLANYVALMPFYAALALLHIIKESGQGQDLTYYIYTYTLLITFLVGLAF